jgi:vacuole morphology and inheritance protein 14
MQVVRGDFIIFFNRIFDALCKLSADSDPNVQSAAHLLDRLVKVNKCSLPLSIH